MAATGWTYFVPYQQDAERALQDLRNDVFTRGAYLLPGDWLGSMSDEAIAAAMPPTAELQKLLNLSKAIDRAMKDLGADTRRAEKDTQRMEQFLRQAEKEGVAKAARKAVGRQRKKAPKSIEHARGIAGEAGTHSILDIEATSTVRQFAHATPLAPETLIALFGTDKPTRDAAHEKEKAGELFGLGDLWEASYFTVFEGDRPSEIVFCGRSGD